ncbi:MAG: hypothetical protein JXA16_05940 [Bacteroidales bacterium]|nr:hypothetical protein [Bacteroidales bacterium]
MIFLTFSFYAFAQNDSITKKPLKYSVDFKFNDGVYMGIEDVKRNNPIPKARIVYSGDYNDYSFFENVLSGDIFYVLDNLGQKRELLVKEIWGFSQNGILFIYWNNEFNRIPVFGSISHFIADKTVIDNNYNPYDNYYNRYNSFYYPTNQNIKKELMQYLLDMETGNIMNYNYKNVEILLMKDDKLYEEFVKLKKKEKKQLKFLYLRKYNEKHPFYFITN